MDATFFEDLSSTVEIQANATVSKVVHSDDRIRVVMFAFDAGQELTEHTARSPIVVEVVRGEVELDAGSRTYVMGPHSWIHLPADEPHSVRARVPTVMALTLLRSS